MNGFEYDKSDPHSTISVNTLRVHLRPKITDLQPTMLQKIEDYFKIEVFQRNVTEDTWVTLKTLPMARHLTGIVNAFVMMRQGLGMYLPAISVWQRSQRSTANHLTISLD